MGVSKHAHLIDSSIWIRLFRRSPQPALAARVREILDARTAATLGIIRVEILSAAKNDGEFLDYSHTLGQLIQLPITEETYLRAARLGYRLRRVGVSSSTPDLIIAASAREHEAVLIHADSDFDRIAESSDLRVESYAASV